MRDSIYCKAVSRLPNQHIDRDVQGQSGESHKIDIARQTLNTAKSVGAVDNAVFVDVVGEVEVVDIRLVDTGLVDIEVVGIDIDGTVDVSEVANVGEVVDISLMDCLHVTLKLVLP